MNIKYLYHRFIESRAVKYIRDRKKIISITIVFFIIVPIISLIWIKSMLYPKDATSTAFIEFEVVSGSNANQLAAKMHDLGIIKNQFVFSLYAKYTGKDNKIKAGKYHLSPSMSPEEILDKLVNGQSINEDIKVTIPEGSTLKTIAGIFSEKGLVSQEEFFGSLQIDKFKNKHSILQDFPPNATLEGFLFPDTYFLPLGKNAEFYIDILLKRFEEVYFDKVDSAVKQNNIDLTPYEVVTLASIVEAEAKVDSERPIISAVFQNRLKLGMPLQSCATVAYALGEHKAELSLDDLEIDSPYNTYKVNHLPPGPIGAPGLSSMLAVANPADVDYLFFVAKGDGTHIFTRTYSEHLEAQAMVESNK
ncbi:endolytic transglycosylase MltG [Tepidanaerobacter sp. GT38]|uniref:endolytic transglycosylase MltG n=1 Tax=Tepidanaerobacter sp. GT38 TaxID=2722793 RepID=UPI001F000A37|nr:endolytic transglycosylase MltG [Tepidanaerobacter sp. GT38]MCG1012994.1 endolytic transglycosylase MltG [Tepidanaerobacter sp. GT38]